jgi:riboflavin transporter FmnP
MLGWNLIITPIYMGVPVEAVIAMIIPIFLPFNLLKAGVNSVVAFLVYKPIARFLHR